MARTVSTSFPPIATYYTSTWVKTVTRGAQRTAQVTAKPRPLVLDEKTLASCFSCLGPLHSSLAVEPKPRSYERHPADRIRSGRKRHLEPDMSLHYIGWHHSPALPLTHRHPFVLWLWPGMRVTTSAAPVRMGYHRSSISFPSYPSIQPWQSIHVASRPAQSTPPFKGARNTCTVHTCVLSREIPYQKTAETKKNAAAPFPNRLGPIFCFYRPGS